MPSSSAVRRVAGLAVVGLCVAGFATHAHVARARVRPSVALKLSIEGDYRHHLLDADCTRRCDSMVKALDAGVRSALAAQYPFINWSAAGEPTADTIVIRWENVSEFFAGSRLKFELREAGLLLDSVGVDFEVDTVISARMESDWQVEPLRRSWQARLPNALRGSDLLPRIFGRVPLNAAVDFTPPGDIFVPAHRDSLKAAAPHPVFELSVQVNSAALNIDDTGTVVLNECSLAQRNRGYTCPVRAIALPNRVFGNADVMELRRTRSVKWRATRLRSYKPGALGVGLAGVPQ